MLLRQPRTGGARRPDLRVVQATAVDTAPDLSRRSFVLLLSAVVLLGVFVRAPFVFAADFPLGDGGLFYQMARDLQHAGYVLPSTTTYNHAGIPFAYPPLTLYAAALVDRATPLSLFDALRFLPLVGSIATIAIVGLLARDMLASRTSAVAAAFAFAMVPRGFAWLIMGGGLTRGFGVAFALLTIHAAYLLFTRRRWRFAASATLFGSLGLLSHIEMTWFAAFSSAILFAAYGRHRMGVLASIAVCAGVALFTSPWWLTVIARHGLEPFVSAMNARNVSSSNPLVVFIGFRFTSELLFPLASAFGVLGALVCLSSRRYMLPAWLLATAILDARSLGTVASVPLALLAAIAFTEVVLPIVSRRSHDSASGPPHTAFPAAAAVTVACVAMYGVLAAMVSMPKPLTAMTLDERAAMQWAATDTPPESRFLVVSGDMWGLDRTLEWLPALTGRVSALTPQGYEWLPDHVFNDRLQANKQLQECATKLPTCIDAWSATSGIEYDYLYLPRLSPRVVAEIGDDELECCAALRESLGGDARYEAVFDNAGATIFRRRQ